MSNNWWEFAYKGAPPPGGLIQLVRPLYPPDATKKGKKPSSPGKDCEAIARGISRGGRAPWDWATGSNKREWSNRIAHGGGGNVSVTGAAGFQRQMSIDGTGWWGTQSNSALQYALIPDELPHGGEHLLDDVARKLLHEALDEIKGPTATVRQAALADAATYVGYKESPADTNSNMFGAWYGMNYEPWCAMFITYCFEVGAGGSPSFERGSRYAYVPYIVTDAQEGRFGLSVTSAPVPGDVVCFDWDGGVADHVELFESGAAVNFTTIGGNTASDDMGDQSNGGTVARKQRSVASAHTVTFVRVAEP